MLIEMLRVCKSTKNECKSNAWKCSQLQNPPKTERRIAFFFGKQVIKFITIAQGTTAEITLVSFTSDN